MQPERALAELDIEASDWLGLSPRLREGEILRSPHSPCSHPPRFWVPLSRLSLGLPYLHPSLWPSLAHPWAPKGAPYLGSSHFPATAFTGDISCLGSMSAPPGLASQQPVRS